MFLQSQRFLLAFLLMATVFFTNNPATVSAAWQSPPQEFIYSGGDSTAIASDANGHAFVTMYDYLTDSVLASYYTSGAWTTPEIIGTGNGGAIAIAMDDSGTALAIWYNLGSGNISTANFNGTSWNTPSPSPLDTITGFTSPSLAIAMNGPNEGVAVWIDDTTTLVHSAFFSAGSWSTPTIIGNGSYKASIDYSANGTVVAGWDNNGAFVNNYIGGSWQLPTVLDASAFDGAKVGIDSNGNALAVWSDPTGIVNSSRFDGTSWSPSQNISITSGNFEPTISVAPDGTAVAIWITGSSAGESSSYNDLYWSAPIQFTAGPISGLATISVNNSGNALAVWYTGANEIKSARLALGQQNWDPEELITIQNPVGDLQGSLSSDGTGFAAWVLPSEGSFYFASATIATPASNIEASSCKIKFATQTDRVNIITFDPSTDSSVVSYKLSRNGVLIATFGPEGPFIYEDHNRCKRTYTYSLVAVSSNGTDSTPISISITAN